MEHCRVLWNKVFLLFVYGPLFETSQENDDQKSRSSDVLRYQRCRQYTQKWSSLTLTKIWRRMFEELQLVQLVSFYLTSRPLGFIFWKIFHNTRCPIIPETTLALQKAKYFCPHEILELALLFFIHSYIVTREIQIAFSCDYDSYNFTLRLRLRCAIFCRRLNARADFCYTYPLECLEGKVFTAKNVKVAWEFLRVNLEERHHFLNQWCKIWKLLFPLMFLHRRCLLSAKFLRPTPSEI